VPSDFLAALRIFDDLLHFLPEPSQPAFLRGSLGPVLSAFPAFTDLPGFAEAFSLPITSILLRETLRPFQGQVISALPRLLVPHSHASFLALAFGVYLAIRACSPTTPELRHLCDVGESLGTEPASHALVALSLQMLRERGHKAASPAQREAFIIENATAWLRECARFDCVAMADVLYEWAKTLEDALGFEHASAVVCGQFYKWVPRFFPLFVAMARFVRRRAPAAGREIVQVRLEEASLVNPCRAHAVAIAMLARGDRRAACTLASFAGDCDESDRLIAAVS
jgi:hypothetical protein